MLRLRAQIPKYPCNDEPGATKNESVERFAIERPSDQCNERNAQEVEGTTMVASPERNALVRHQCVESPVTVMPSSGRYMDELILKIHDGSLVTKFIGNCMRFIQNRIANVLCVAVNFLVVMRVIAIAIADTTTRSTAG